MSRVPKSLPSWLPIFVSYIGSKDNSFNSAVITDLVVSHWGPFREYNSSITKEDPKSATAKEKPRSKKRKKTDDDDFSEYLGNIDENDLPRDVEISGLDSYVNNDNTSYNIEDHNASFSPSDILDNEANTDNLDVSSFVEKNDLETPDERRAHVVLLKNGISEHKYDMSKKELFDINDHLFLLINKLLEKIDLN